MFLVVSTYQSHRVLSRVVRSKQKANLIALLRISALVLRKDVCYARGAGRDRNTAMPQTAESFDSAIN